MDANLAINYIKSHGDPFEQARLRYVMSGLPATQTEAEALFGGQRADGGWSPFWAADYSSLDATCFRLAQAEAVGLMDSAAAQRAARFLEGRQASQGWWEEDQSVAETAPPWAKPGDLAARLYLTANCGFWLSLYSGRNVSVQLASGVLSSYLTEDGRLPSFFQTHWLAAGLWQRVGESSAAEGILRYLSGRLSELPVCNLAWMLTSLLAAGVSPAQPNVEPMLDRLEQSQHSSGAWLNEEDSGQTVHTTLEALRILAISGRIQLPDVW